MKFLFASDSFKGTLSSETTIDLLARAAKAVFGKVIQGVGEKAKGIAAVGLSGSLGRDAGKIFDCGIESLMTTVDAPMPLEEALSRAEELYYLGAVRMFRFFRTGMEIAKKQ